MITYLAGSSSSWELSAGRTGPTVIALPWLQTARKTVSKRVRVSQSYNYTIGVSLSVRSEIRMIDVSTYEGAYDMGDIAPPWNSAVPRTSGIAEFCSVKVTQYVL